MIKAGIIGSTGYAGNELVRLLMNHPEVEITWYGSRSYVDEKYASVYKNMFKLIEDKCLDDNIEKMSKEADVIFTATPQGYLAGILTEDILSNAKVIDLSADYRIKDVATYEKWYGITHKSPEFIEEAVYGLCEINREKVKSARLIANPGCYTTCSILTAYPLVRDGLIDVDTLIVDAKSGTSGAGRGAKVQNLYCEVNENIKAYGVATHRHTPEIEEQLGYALADCQKTSLAQSSNPAFAQIPSTSGADTLASTSSGDEILSKRGNRILHKEVSDRLPGGNVTINFTPHLVPMNRGILATEYASLKKVNLPDGSVGYPDEDMIRDCYKKYYKDEYFIRLLDKGMNPETRWVEGSNFVDINFVIDERTNRVIMMGALDNICKGAAGQAVQNMNIMFGFKESEGLELIPMC